MGLLGNARHEKVAIAFVLFQANIPLRFDGGYKLPRLPAPFYRMSQKMLRTRWVIHDLLNANRLGK